MSEARLYSFFLPVLLASAAAGVLPGGALAQGGPALEEAAARAAVETFHAALASGDSAAALAALHPDVVVYESGHAETLEEYRSGHLASDMAFSRAVSFTTLRDAVVPEADLAVYHREYTLAGTYRERVIDARGVETMVLVRTGAGWKIRHIHWSSR